MIRYSIICCVGSIFFLVGCQSKSSHAVKDTSKEVLLETIQRYETILENDYKSLMENSLKEIPSDHLTQLSEAYISFYDAFHKDTLTPYYLDKLHQLYLQDKRYTYSVAWADTLISNYPSYKGKANVLISAASTTDMFLNDTTKVKRFYLQLLKDYPKLNNELKKFVDNRLDNLSMNYLEWIKVNQDNS
jgi:hypothetical protein